MSKAVRNRMVLYVMIGGVFIFFSVSSVLSSHSDLVVLEKEKNRLSINMTELVEEQEYLEEELIRFEDPYYVLNYAKKNHLFTEDGTIKFRIPNKTSN